jgi:hypothetical protein
MAQHYPDDQIAQILNQQQFPTATGLSWTRARVYAVRRKHRIPSACPLQSASPKPRGDGLVKARSAAQRLGVHPSMIADWFSRGLIDGCQAKPRSPLWVSLDDHIFQRLNGQHPLTADMHPLRQVQTSLDLSDADLCDRIRSGEFTPYRICQHNRWRWFLKPAARLANPLCSDQ